MKILSLSDTDEVFVPMRIIPNNENSEVLLTLFQIDDISEDKFIEDSTNGTRSKS